MRCPPPRPTTSPRAGPTRRFAPSFSSVWRWLVTRRRPGWRSGRWWPTAPTATRTPSAASWPPPGWRLCWPSGGAGACGPTGTRRTPLSMLPGRWPGVAPTIPATGPRWPHLPRRTHRHLVGRRRAAGLVGPGRDDPAGGGDHRPGCPARDVHLVSGHQPAPTRIAPCRPQPPPARRPGRARAALRDQELDRAELQAGQGRIGVGRLPGPLRCRHPSPPDPGQLRLLFLLAGHRRCRLAATPAPTRPAHRPWCTARSQT
jgi:hypothetical protein